MHGCEAPHTENTVGEQWIADLPAAEPCSSRKADAPVGRNPLIAPIGRGPLPIGSGASGQAEWRNKAIAPYDPHLASFNFWNPLIWSAESRRWTLLCARVIGS